MMFQERRRAARIKMSVEVEITSGSNFFAGRTRDVSTGGLFIETDVDLPIGSEVELDLVLAGRRHTARAEVAWVLGGGDGATEGVGVRFVQLPSRTAAAITSFMVRRQPMPFEAIDAEGAPLA
jgi:uncharacterized protein (TIGR02266 family)